MSWTFRFQDCQPSLTPGAVTSRLFMLKSPHRTHGRCSFAAENPRRAAHTLRSKLHWISEVDRGQWYVAKTNRRSGDTETRAQRMRAAGSLERVRPDTPSVRTSRSRSAVIAVVMTDVMSTEEEILPSVVLM